jgi:serine/threonine-protein kinase
VLKCEDSQFKTLLQREIAVQCKIGGDCANIPTFIDAWYSSQQEELYIVMQWIPGKTMRNFMDTMVSTVFLQNMIIMCDVLQVFSSQGMSHKDIKPENIMITPQGTLYLIDFNLSLTEQVLGIGTENYRAPEMVMPGTGTNLLQADIFSIGVMLYEFFTGECPMLNTHYFLNIFHADQTRWTDFKRPKEINDTIPDSLDELIVKCMAYSPRSRYNNPAQLKRALIECKKTLRNWKKRK